MGDLEEVLKTTWLKFRKQYLHCQKAVNLVNKPFNLTKLAIKTRQILLSDYLYLSKNEGYLLTLIDSLSRVTVLLHCKSANAENVVKILCKFHSFYELDENFLLVSDQGSHFMNQVVDLFLKQSGGAHYFTCVYAPFSNGSTEVQNRVF
eukprot:snap_masked-scaffold_104-processed-gene-0.10-mRNA-1 protein AED:0.68 eAED:0.70 QI:0/0/0/0.5/1/1/2/0/148